MFIANITKEAVKTGATEMLKDGSKLFATGVYNGFILATGVAGVKLGYAGWTKIYAGIGDGIKKLSDKIKEAKGMQLPPYAKDNSLVDYIDSRLTELSKRA